MAMDISIGRTLLEAMLEFAIEQHPREIVLLLRGRAEKRAIQIDDFLVPPLAVAGESFTEFPLYRLPIDFSIVGTAHSHPSGVLAPSVGDLNNFYGRVMVIFASPYRTSRVAAFNSKGERIPLAISD